MRQFTAVERKATVGDAAVLVLLTVAGFATHLTLDAFWRMVVTVGGSLVAWFVVGPFLGVFRERNILNPKKLWRVGLAWAIAAPLATFLRGLVLARDIPPVFVVVVILVNGFALVAWRLYLGWRSTKRRQADSTSIKSPR